MSLPQRTKPIDKHQPQVIPPPSLFFSAIRCLHKSLRKTECVKRREIGGGRVCAGDKRHRKKKINLRRQRVVVVSSLPKPNGIFVTRSKTYVWFSEFVVVAVRIAVNTLTANTHTHTHTRTHGEIERHTWRGLGPIYGSSDPYCNRWPMLCGQIRKPCNANELKSKLKTKPNCKPKKRKKKKHLTKNLSKKQVRDGGGVGVGEEHLTALLKSCNNNFLTLICMPEIVLTTVNQCYFMLSTCCIAACNIGMWNVE